MNLTIPNAEKLSLLELRACVSAFKASVKAKTPRGGKKLYKRGKDFQHECDVLIKRTTERGNYIAEVK